MKLVSKFALAFVMGSVAFVPSAYAQKAKKDKNAAPAAAAPAEKQPVLSKAFQLPEGFIAANKDNHLIIVDQRAAHERILFDKYFQNTMNRKAPVQQLLFPRTLELSAHDYALAHDIIEEMKDIGFDVQTYPCFARDNSITGKVKCA